MNGDNKMALYIEVHDDNKKYLGRLYLRDDKIEVEAIDELHKENFEEDIRLWKQNHRDRGITDDVTLFPTIPILTSNWSRVIFSDIKEIKE